MGVMTMSKRNDNILVDLKAAKLGIRARSLPSVFRRYMNDTCDMLFSFNPNLTTAQAGKRLKNLGWKELDEYKIACIDGKWYSKKVTGRRPVDHGRRYRKGPSVVEIYQVSKYSLYGGMTNVNRIHAFPFSRL